MKSGRIAPIELWTLGTNCFDGWRFKEDRAYASEVLRGSKLFNPLTDPGYSAKCIYHDEPRSPVLVGLACPQVGYEVGHSEIRNFYTTLVKIGLKPGNKKAFQDEKLIRGGRITIDPKIPLLVLHGRSEAFPRGFKDEIKSSSGERFGRKVTPESLKGVLLEYARVNWEIDKPRSFPAVANLSTGDHEWSDYREADGSVNLVDALFSGRLGAGLFQREFII